VVVPPPIVQAPNIQQAPVIMSVPRPPPMVVSPPAPPPPPPPPVPTVSKAAAAKGDPARWFTTDDYPPRALREGAEGSTRIAWDINNQGRAENCRVLSSSGSADLDDASCRVILRKGRYSPALDQNGNPMKVTNQQRTVRWQIPK
jgi:protein TonB